MSTVAIIVAAGSSRRMGFDKLTADLAGRPVLAHSLLTFEHCEDVDHIVIVAAAGRKEEFRLLAEGSGIEKLAAVIEGGAERCLSVWKGVQMAMKVATNTAIILVHDGARPLVAGDAISQCIHAAEEHGAASLARRVTDTLKRADDSAVVTESVIRENLWRMETPQAFEAKLLLQASGAAVDDSVVVTDEVSAVQRFNASQAIHLVENTSANLKITMPGDLPIAEALMK